MVLNKAEFISANVKDVGHDIKCIITSYGSRGILTDIFKLNKSKNITEREALCILLGRMTCFAEEWDYSESSEDTFSYIFEPKRVHTKYIHKIFKPVAIEEFRKVLEGYLSYLEIADPNMNFSKSFNLKGQDFSLVYEPTFRIERSEINKLDLFQNLPIIKVFGHTEIWHWRTWFIESNEAYYLYEENIAD